MTLLCSKVEYSIYIVDGYLMSSFYSWQVNCSLSYHACAFISLVITKCECGTGLICTSSCYCCKQAMQQRLSYCTVPVGKSV